MIPAKWQLYVAVLAGLLLAGVAAYGFGYFRGSTAAASAAALREEAANTAHLKELLKLNERQSERERGYEQNVSELRQKYASNRTLEKAQDDAASTAFSSGARRMRLPSSGAACPTQGAGAVSATPRVDAQPRAELAPEAAAALWGISGDGDDAIRQLTALQAYTQQLYSTCTEQGMTK